MPEGNAAFGEVVGRKFECHAITREDTNAIAAQTAGQMCQNYVWIVFELNAEKTAGKFL